MNLGAMNRFTPLPQQALQGQSVKQQRQGTLPKNAAKILLDVAFEHGKDVTPALTYHWKSLIAEGATQKELEDLWVKIPTLEEAKTRLNKLLNRSSLGISEETHEHTTYRAKLAPNGLDVVPLETPVLPKKENPNAVFNYSPFQDGDLPQFAAIQRKTQILTENLLSEQQLLQLLRDPNLSQKKRTHIEKILRENLAVREEHAPKPLPKMAETPEVVSPPIEEPKKKKSVLILPGDPRFNMNA